MIGGAQVIMAAGEVNALLNRGIFVSGVVLVHGLYHDPQHFNLVVGELAAARVEVAVPELHRGSLQADTEAVQAVVDAMEQPPLVVGHSYGGSVITGLTGAAHLVYLAAFVPAEGERGSSRWFDQDPRLLHRARRRRRDPRGSRGGHRSVLRRRPDRTCDLGSVVAATPETGMWPRRTGMPIVAEHTFHLRHLHSGSRD